MKTRFLPKIVLLLVILLGTNAVTLSAQNIGEKFQHTDGLYYRITSLNPATVEIAPQNDESPYWNEGEQPTGGLTIPEQVTHYDVIYDVTAIGNNAFSDCIGLTGNLIIGNNVKSIGNNAFSYCNFTGGLIIPNSVTNIGDEVFIGCNEFSGNLTIGNNVITIGGSAFEYTGFTGSLTIPNSVTTIGSRAFMICNNISGSLTIGKGVTFIGKSAFSGCLHVKKFVVLNDNPNYSNNEDGLLLNKEQTILIQYPLGNFRSYYIIPNTVTTIETYAFSYSYKLKNITIPYSVSTIESLAFFDCTGMTTFTVSDNNPNYSSNEDGLLLNKEQTNIIQYPIGNSRTTYIIPNEVTSIGNFSFFHCENLISVTINHGTSSIGELAFYKCSKLTSVIIPGSVTSIKGFAFGWCFQLKSVTCLVNNPDDMNIDDHIFYNTPINDATLYVPQGSVPLYESAEQWQEFGTIKEIGIGIDDPTMFTNFSLYPNPATDYVFLSWDSSKGENIHISMYQLSGNKVYEQYFVSHTGSFNHTISVKDYAKGTYLLTIKTDSGSITKKIMVK